MPARPAPFYKTNVVATTILASLAMLALAHPALAQEAAAAAAEPVVHEKTLYERIMVAGPVFMGMLFIASMSMFWLVLDGILKTARTKLAPPAVVSGLRQHLINGDYEAATHTVNASETVFGEVASAAFTKVGLGKDATDDAIFEELERTRAVFLSRISYLSVIGVITPMIGLTGTVFGMIHAFDTLGSSGVGDPAKLSEAIGEVLVCTGGGLVVAIPAFAFYYVLRNRIAAGFRHVQVEINEIFHHLPYEYLTGLRLEVDAFVPAPPRAAAEATGGTEEPASA
jgi:biopolymer transport protein ExbB